MNKLELHSGFGNPPPLSIVVRDEKGCVVKEVRVFGSHYGLAELIKQLAEKAGVEVKDETHD